MSDSITTVCQHTACDDESDVTVTMETGEQYDLCEDHANMDIDGAPVDGYTPNDPDKFTAEAW